MSDFVGLLNRLARNQGRILPTDVEGQDETVPPMSLPVSTERKIERAKTIAVNRGRVGTHDFVGMSVPEAVDTMAIVPLQMESLAADRRLQDSQQRLMDLMYPAPPPGSPPGTVVVSPMDVVPEALLGMPQPFAPSRPIDKAQPPPLAPNFSAPPVAGQFRQPLRAPSPDPVEAAYGHLDTAVSAFGPERAYAALAEQYPIPHDFARMLAGQLEARRRRLVGPGPGSDLDPVTLGALGGPGPTL